MARRIYTYPDQGVMPEYNLVSTIGSYTMGAGLLLFFVNVLMTRRRGRRVDNDPWLADTLEWYTTSPPPPLELRPRPVRDERAPAARPPAAARASSLS